jgi:hypothetical protein
MTMTLKPSHGNKRTLKRIDNIERTIKGVIDNTWDDFGSILHKEAIKDINKTKRGRVYVVRSRAGNRRRHRASAPGESHANVTKTLTNSLGEKNKGSLLEFGYMDSPPKYAGIVEKTRPTLENTAKRNQGEVRKLFNSKLKKEFK